MRNLNHRTRIHIKYQQLLLFIFSGLLFSVCEKQGRYDLFPMKVGNEFYYKYEKRDLIATTKGTETWKVVSESSLNGTVKYLIERKLNGVVQIGINQTVITDRITSLEVTGDKSSSIILWDFRFDRYQDKSQSELRIDGYTSLPSVTILLKADSGLTSYNYYHPPNQVSNITLTLDSVKTVR